MKSSGQTLPFIWWGGAKFKIKPQDNPIAIENNS